MQIIARGTVLDADTLETLPGAHIYIVRNGERIPANTTTDMSGKFTIQSMGLNDKIGISYVGYDFQEFDQVGGDFKLQPKAFGIGEVTVIGTKETKKANYLPYILLFLLLIAIIYFIVRKNKKIA